MSENVIVRREIPGDEKAIYEISLAAFPSKDEAEVVDYLRANDDSYSSWVAAFESQVVAHILFTSVKISGFESMKGIYGLAPMAVLPEYQNRGIGSKLIIESLKEMQADAAKAVFVLGHREFYPRFGFEKAIEHGFYYKSEQFSDNFFGLELKPNYLNAAKGEVLYNRIFDNL